MSTGFLRSVVAVAVAVVVVLAACGDDRSSTDPIDEPTDEPTDEPDVTAPASDPTGDWVMVDGPTAPIAGWDVTVTIDGDQIGGRAACNSFGGTVTWGDDGTISVGQLSQTEMACEPSTVMELESTFLAALMGADRFAVDGDRLTITSGDDAWAFDRLPPVPTADLVGTTWQLDGYLDGDAVSNEAGMESATLTLHADGTMTGTTNCRTLTGTWVESGAQVFLPELAADGECTDAAASDLDSRIIGVLGDGFAATVDGRRLTLTSQGGVGLTYVAVE
ncbi:MAG: META domain-containing protein [Acidimicrobiia bacterium]